MWDDARLVRLVLPGGVSTPAPRASSCARQHTTSRQGTERHTCKGSIERLKSPRPGALVSSPLNPAPARYAARGVRLCRRCNASYRGEAPRLTVAMLPSEERTALKFGCRSASGRSQRNV
jgi:hypothetical protein